MIAKALDRTAEWAVKHERLIEIVVGVWFVLSWASHAQFIDLPEIPLLTDRIALFASTGVNALWWGWLRPAIERRKEASNG